MSKKIQLTIGELSGIVDNLNTVVKTPMPAKYAFRFSKVAISLQNEMNQFKNKRDALIRKYGIVEGDNIKVAPENSQKYAEEIKTMALHLIELDFEPIPLSVLGDSKFTSLNMIGMEKFFYDDEEAKV